MYGSKEGEYDLGCLSGGGVIGHPSRLFFTGDMRLNNPSQALVRKHLRSRCRTPRRVAIFPTATQRYVFREYSRKFVQRFRYFP